MSNYTRKERNEIYKKALELLDIKLFLCHALSNVIQPDLKYLKQPELFQLLPEFAMFDPDSFYPAWDFGYSHVSLTDDRNKRPRQIVLDFCILMTETE